MKLNAIALFGGLALSGNVNAASVIGSWDDLPAPVDRYSAECDVNGVQTYTDYALPTSDFTVSFPAMAGDTVTCHVRGDWDIAGTTVPGNWSADLVGTTAEAAPAPSGFSLIIVVDTP